MNDSEALQKQISALTIIDNELSHFYAICPDFSDSAAIRQQAYGVEEELYTKQAELDALNAGTGVNQPLTDAQVASLEQVLTSLDKYVRNDDNTNMCISYLTQVLNAIGNV